MSNLFAVRFEFPDTSLGAFPELLRHFVAIC
jgi:hypothetical protein